MMSSLLFRAVLLAGIVAPATALAARSDWSPADESRLRLLLTTTDDGSVDGGIELLLEPGWFTYWRTPGESGVPPLFDFSGSENVADVEVHFPVPVRHDDGASVSLVYEDEVVFPLSITPVHVDAPVTLKLRAEFGVCMAICIPTGASSEVTLAPGAAADPLTNVRLREFARRIPKSPDAGRFDIENVVAEGDALTIDVRMPDSSYSDLFAEAPGGWYLGQPTFVGRTDGVSRYHLSLAGKPKDAIVAGQEFRFVAVAGSEAIEKRVEIR